MEQNPVPSIVDGGYTGEIDNAMTLKKLELVFQIGHDPTLQALTNWFYFSLSKPHALGLP